MYVYLVKSLSKPRMFKIGRSVNPYERLATLQTGSPVPLSLVGFVKCLSPKNTMYVESQFHRRFARSRRIGEWFQLSNQDFCKIEAPMRQGMQDFIDQGKAEKLHTAMNHEYIDKLRLEFS
jgi:hypothetical protein